MKLIRIKVDPNQLLLCEGCVFDIPYGCKRSPEIILHPKGSCVGRNKKGEHIDYIFNYA